MLDDIRDLLKNVALISDKSSNARFFDFASEFEKLSRSLEAIRGLQSEADRNEASHFNLLDWLGIERLENTHTRILARLLNPLGTHGQGTLFLRRFLSHFLNPSGSETEAVSADFVVVAEESTALGRTDIRLASRNLSIAIIIENKIDASDQEGQLARYRRHLNEGFGSYKTRRLFYLTLSGRKSSDPSAANVSYVPISYNRDIAGWLNSCVDEIPASAVREFVRRYATIVANLKEATNGQQI